MIMIVPILLITLLYFLLGDSDYIPTVMFKDIPKPFADVIEKSAHIKIITDGEADAVISYNNGAVHIVMKEPDMKRFVNCNFCFIDAFNNKVTN